MKSGNWKMLSKKKNFGKTAEAFLLLHDLRYLISIYLTFLFISKINRFPTRLITKLKIDIIIFF